MQLVKVGTSSIWPDLKKNKMERFVQKIKDRTEGLMTIIFPE
jgi:hypothetical protein